MSIESIAAASGENTQDVFHLAISVSEGHVLQQPLQ